MNKVNNQVKPKAQIKDEEITTEKLNSYLYKNEKLVIDFSFEYVFTSGKSGDLDNYLHDKDEFLDKLKDLFNNVTKLSKHTAQDLINNYGFRHCHNIDESKRSRCVKLISKVLENYNKSPDYILQLVEGETLYQLAYETSVRMIGLLNGNRFRVLFLDYHHNLYPDEHRNTRPRQNNTYSFFT